MAGVDILVLLVILLAGLIRGITGFGGAMLMAPPLSLLIGPVPAVLTALVLETAAAVPMLPGAWRHIDRRLLLLLSLPACLTVPLGVLVLVSIDPVLARRIISGIVAVFSLAMLAGFRYHGSPRRITTAAVGALAGVLLGATSAGGPPAILYLMSGPHPQMVTRANLIAFITITSIAGLVVLLGGGAVPYEAALPSAVLVLPYLAAVFVGGRLFSRMADAHVRRLALVLMLTTGTAGLVL